MLMSGRPQDLRNHNYITQAKVEDISKAIEVWRDQQPDEVKQQISQNDCEWLAGEIKKSMEGERLMIERAPNFLTAFKDWTSKRWMDGAWRNKLAAGFTASASWNGDKHNTLCQLLTLALQHGMVWVGLGLPGGYNHSKGSVDDLNRLGASVGAMAQANADQGIEGIAASDFRTMEALGRRVAEAALRWREEPLAKAA